MLPLVRLLRSKPVVDELQRTVKGMNKSNWKTSLPGVLTCVLALALIWAPPEYREKLLATQAALVGVGLVAAKDHDK